MELLGGYGSGSDVDDEVENVPTFKPMSVSTAPPTSNRPQADLEPALEASEEPQKPRLVAPKGPVVVDDDDPGVGPARPQVAAVTDEREIPGISNPEVWSKLPAPKAPAYRRVVQMKLPIHKTLLDKDVEDEEDDKDAAAARARKRARQGADAAKSALLDFLPAPKNELGGGGGFGAAGGMIDLGESSPIRANNPGAAAAAPKQQRQQGSASNEQYRVQPAAGGKATTSGKPASRVSELDSDDEDPMARLGPMPEAGSYAAGPIADDGVEGVEAGLIQEQTGYEDQQQQYGGHVESAAAYYVGGEEAGQGGAGYTGQQQYGGATHAEEGDVGQQLFEQALEAERQKASRRGQALDMSSIQFKEVNAKDLTYMDPVAREVQRAARQALGSEYAAQLRAEAKPFEGDKTAKRKHQIGTLFYNAKMKELEILEGQTAGMKAKGETKGKYGW